MVASRRTKKVTYEGLSNGLLFCPNFSMCRGEGVHFERDALGKWSNDERLVSTGPKGSRFALALQASPLISKIFLESRELFIWLHYTSHVPNEEASAEEMLALLDTAMKAFLEFYAVQPVNILPESQFRLFESLHDPSETVEVC